MGNVYTAGTFTGTVDFDPSALTLALASNGGSADGFAWKLDPSGAVRKTSGFPLLCLAEGVNPAELRFGELGYAMEARASYLDFCAARSRGELPPGVRFQVCLPTPMGVI